MKTKLNLLIGLFFLMTVKLSSQDINLALQYYNDGTKTYKDVASAQGVTSAFDKAYYLSGKAGIPKIVSVGSLQEVSFAFWYKKMSNAADLPVIASYNTSGGAHPTYGYKISVVDKKKINFLIIGDVSPDKYEVNSDATTIDDEQWHFIVVRFSGFEHIANRTTIYVDNKKVNTSLTSNQFNQTRIRESQDGITHIGYTVDYNGNFNFFTGILDEIRVYSRVITEANIQDLYNAKAK